MKNRFLHLESERPERPRDGQPTDTPGAHAGTQGLEGAAPPPTTTATARFSERPAPGAPAREDLAARLPPEALAPQRSPAAARFAPEAPPLALAERPQGALPFRRCATCGVDSHRAARECQHCHADLETEAQHAFMRTVTESFERERALEAERSAQFAAEQAEAEKQAQKARRAYGEALAASSRKKIERQLSNEPFEHAPSIGVALYRAIPKEHRTKVLVCVSVVAAIASAIVARGAGKGPLLVVAILAGLLALLFIPPRFFTRGDRIWWWWS